MIRRLATLPIAFLLAPLLAGLIACSGGPDADPTDPGQDPAGDLDPDSAELEPFREMARSFAACTASQEHLWLVDGTWVAFDVRTPCPDVGSPLRLYDAASYDELCAEWIDVAGGGLACEPGAPSALFEIIRLHRDEPNLGLGPDHVVEAVPF